MIVRDSYAWASPYVNADPEKLFGTAWSSLYGRQIWTAKELEERLAAAPERPEIFLLGNFMPNREALEEVCRRHEINFAHWEDGFFPHYETQHLDPVGFCWESSLCQTVFREVSDRQRARARSARASWLERPVGELPPSVRKPFVFWPLQLIGDQVNRFDLNVSDWTGLIRNFRQRLPEEFQLVLKVHPFAADGDLHGIEALIRELPHSVLVSKEADLTSLVRECQAVAGANSSVLYEARLMHHKPAYAYSRSWFTNHPELVTPLSLASDGAAAAALPQVEAIENPTVARTAYLDDYADWFLAHLLARQIDNRQFTNHTQRREAIWRLSHQSYRTHGEAIFDV